MCLLRIVNCHSYQIASKPSFPPGSGLISHLPNKRDSSKLLSSAPSAKDQLHTLMEEEEEEEEEIVPSSVNDTKSAESLPAPVQLPPQPSKHTPNRPRPSCLNLRPLSLTPESLSVIAAQNPPSMPSGRNGLKSLSLSSSATPVDSSDLPRNHGSNRRSFTFPLRARLSGDGTTSSTEDSKPRRRSTISYKKASGVTINHAGLPTPEATPTYHDRHFSLSESLKSSSEDEFFPTKARPLSAGEQHFLVKSHNALLTRITDLERVLSMRASSSTSYHRRLSSDVSYSSDQTGTTLGEPDDEMLQLIADLKAERDEYKKDVDAWRGRVNEMDKKLVMMSKIVETERRDAWIARSKVGLMEIEKASMEKTLEGNEALLITVQEEKKVLELQNQKLQDEIAGVRADLIQVKQQLDRAQQGDMKSKHLVLLSEEDNCLAEDEDEDSDASFQTSSCDSADEAVFTLDCLDPNGQSALEIIPGHTSKHSLSKSWTFPNGAQTVVDSCRIKPEVDDFFSCLEDTQDGTTILLPSDPSEYSYERSKGLFADALKSYNEDQDPPFIFPGDIHIEVDGAAMQSSEQLPTVLEEEEQVLSDVNENTGGICITLTPAQDDDEHEDQEEDINFFISPSEPPVLPPFDFHHSVEDLSNTLSFGFGDCDVFETPPADSRSPTPKAELVNPTSSIRSSDASPALEQISQFVQDLYSTPSKRGRVSPSLIPQPIASPSPIRLATIFPRPRLYALTSSCPPQLIQRSSADSSAHKSSSSVTNGSTSIPQPCILRRRS